MNYKSNRSCNACAIDNKRYGCDFPSLAMVYVPIQSWCEIYDYNRALRNGTIFAQLDLKLGDCGDSRGKECRCHE